MRAAIDALDERFIGLFAERMALCEDVARCKAESGAGVVDPAREQAVLQRVAALVDESLQDDVRGLMAWVMARSRTRQREYFCLLKEGAADPAAAGLPGNKILVLHGPNLNLLGQREPGVYGRDTLETLNSNIAAHAFSLGLKTDCRQSNVEGELVGFIQGSKEYKGIILNAAGYTHTSVALRDAISAVKTPVVEVHISNVHAREAFRHESLIAPVCAGTVAGLGAGSYLAALDYFSRV